MAVNLNGPRADQRGWGPGWPNGQSSRMVSLVVAGVSFPAGCRPEVHDLATILLLESERRGYVNLHPGWCWGYANRPITGTTDVPSNHSWGLALDIDAPQNGYGSSSHTIDAPMGKLWNEYGWRWGGDYTSSPKDWMHFEFMGTPADARDLTDKAARELGGEEDELTDREREMLDKAFALVQEVERELGPGDKTAPAGAAGHRIARAVKHVEHEQQSNDPAGG